MNKYVRKWIKENEASDKVISHKEEILYLNKTGYSYKQILDFLHVSFDVSTTYRRIKKILDEELTTVDIIKNNISTGIKENSTSKADFFTK